MLNTSLIQYRALLARQQTLHQQQHKQLARRIHDEISQQLTLLSLQLSMALMDSKPPANWSDQCQKWSNMVLQLGQNLRTIINELQPRILDDLGLAAALQWYAHSSPHGVRCQVLLPSTPVTLPPAAANELFAICRDIVNELFAPNAVTDVTIGLEQNRESVRVQLSTSQNLSTLRPLVSKSLDALSIHERLFCMDGAVETREDKDNGLAISLSLPVARQIVSDAA